jgi:hypothetical protein
MSEFDGVLCHHCRWHMQELRDPPFGVTDCIVAMVIWLGVRGD